MIPISKLSQKRAKIRCKRAGTLVTLSWTEWPDGEPTEDPTTGATLSTDTSTPVSRSCQVRAFVHFVQPITSGFRKFAEVQAGDAIVDFPLDLYRVTSAGDTALTVGQVLDQVALRLANEGAVNPATAIAIEPHSLKNVMMEFGGRHWVQKNIGEELAANWDTLYSDISITRAFLMRKA